MLKLCNEYGSHSHSDFFAKLPINPSYKKPHLNRYKGGLGRLVPNLYLLPKRIGGGRMRTMLPFLLFFLRVFRGENSFYVRFLETDSVNLLKRRRKEKLGPHFIDVTRKSRRNPKPAETSKCARSKLQLPSFHEVLHYSPHTSERSERSVGHTIVRIAVMKIEPSAQLNNGPRVCPRP